MSKYFYRIFTIIDLHFGAMQPCSSGLGMTLEASDFRSVRRLVALYSTAHAIAPSGGSLQVLTQLPSLARTSKTLDNSIFCSILHT